MKILICETDRDARAMLLAHFKALGWLCDSTSDADDALLYLKSYACDAALLADPLGETDTLALVRRIRAARIRTSIIAATCQAAPNAEVKRIVALLGAGCDDVLRRPLHTGEAAAVIEAVCRRAAGHASDVIEVGDLTVDTGAQQCRWSGRPVRLSTFEYTILRTLAHRVGRAVHRETLHDLLYADGDNRGTRIFDAMVFKIRRKLTDAGAPADFISSKWGVGYGIGLQQKAVA